MCLLLHRSPSLHQGERERERKQDRERPLRLLRLPEPEGERCSLFLLLYLLKDSAGTEACLFPEEDPARGLALFWFSGTLRVTELRGVACFDIVLVLLGSVLVLD